MALRAILRRYLPHELRLRVSLGLRWLRDRRAGIRFADREGTAAPGWACWAAYERPFIDYPGQEHLGAAKRKNQALLAAELDGTLIGPGDVFSVWRRAKRPTRAAGYAEAAALKGGELVTDVGGAICLLSTVVYNVLLLAGLTIVERRCHSVDSYGSRRYFELGRDAAIEYGYIDLRALNPCAEDLLLRVEVDDGAVRAAILGPRPPAASIHLEVTAPVLLPTRPAEPMRFSVTTTRVIERPSHDRVCEDLGRSVYAIPPERESDPFA